MKHLLSIMAVFLLMGCQTTDTTPKDTSPTKPVEHTEEKPQEQEGLEPSKAMQVMKPIFCADIETVHEGLETNSEEKPHMIWKDAVNGYTTMLWLNRVKRTVTVMEYAAPEMGCFTAVGIDLQINDRSQKTKGMPILHQMGLD